MFQCGRGKEEKESGKMVWNNDGLEFYYTAAKNWREVYNSREQCLALLNRWENWEPKDKSKNNPIRTYWRRDKGDVKKKSEKNDSHQEKPWWEVEDLIWI